ARALGVDRFLRVPSTPRTSTIRPRPIVVDPSRPLVILFARAWEADGRTPAVGAGRDALNAQRAACIRELREGVGPAVVGGLARNEHARRSCPDCVADPGQTAKLRYLRLVGRVPIGVATTGLSRSIGWKFAEYVAMGRAIVTEPLLNEVPGALAPET